MAENDIKLSAAAKNDMVLKLVEKGKITIIDFYAEWCPPCKMLSKVLERMKASDIVIKKIDIDKEAELAAELGIDAVPFVAIFDRSGKPAVAFTGYREEEEVRELIRRVRK